MANTLRGQATEQSGARTGLEEELKSSSEEPQAPVALQLPTGRFHPSRPVHEIRKVRGTTPPTSVSESFRVTIPSHPADAAPTGFTTADLSFKVVGLPAGLEEGQVSGNPLAARIRASNHFIGVSSGATLVAAGGIGYLMSLVGGIWLGIGAGLATVAMGLYVNWKLRRTLFPDVLAQNALHRGHKAFVDGRMEWAVAWYAFALNFQPDFAPALLGYGRSQIYLRRFGEARAAFEDFLKVEPSSLRQVIEYVLRELPWEGGLRRDLEGVRVWMQFLAEAIIHHGSGRTAEIRTTVSTVWNQKLTSAYELALFSSGVASLLEGDAQRALEDFQLAVLSYPKLKDPLIGTLKSSVPEWFDEQRHPSFPQQLEELGETSSSFKAPPPQQTGLEEEVSGVSQQTVQSRQKGPLAWVNSKIRVLSLWLALLSSPLASAMAQASSVPSAPVSPPPAVQSVQQIENTPRVISSSWPAKKMAQTRFAPLLQLTKDAPLTIIRVRWDDRKFSQRLVDLQARYPDKIHLVDLRLVKGPQEGLQIGGSQRLSSGRETQQVTLSLADFREMVVGGEKLMFPESTFVYMVDSRGVVEDLHPTWRQLEPYLNGRLVELERQAAEEAQAKAETEKAKAEAEAKAEEEARRKAQVEVERLQKVWQELTTQVQKLKEEVAPLMREVERLKQQPKALQEEVGKLEEQKRQADQAVKELETRRSAAQAETKKLEEEQDRLAKEVEQAKKEATRARAEKVQQQEPETPTAEAQHPSSSLPWFLAGAVAGAAGAGYMGYRIGKGQRSPPPPIVGPLPPGQPESSKKMEGTTSTGETGTAVQLEEPLPAAAPTPTTEVAVALQEQPLEPEKVKVTAEAPAEAAPPLGEIPFPTVEEPSHGAIEKQAYFKSEERARRGEPPNPDEDWLQAETEIKESFEAARAAYLAEIKEAIKQYDSIALSGALKLAQGFLLSVNEIVYKEDAQEVVGRLKKQPSLSDEDRRALLQDVVANVKKQKEEQKIREALPKLEKLIEQVGDMQAIRRAVREEHGHRLSASYSDVAYVLSVADSLELDLKAVTLRNVRQASSAVQERRRRQVAEEMERRLMVKRAEAIEKLADHDVVKVAQPSDIRRIANMIKKGEKINKAEVLKPIAIAAYVVTQQLNLPRQEIPGILNAVIDRRRTAMQEAKRQAGRAAASTVQQLEGDQNPYDRTIRVANAIQARIQEAGGTVDLETLRQWTIGEDSKIPGEPTHLIEALKDSRVEKAARMQPQPPVEEIERLAKELAEAYQVSDEAEGLLRYALSLPPPHSQGGIDLFRWMFDPVAWALRKFSDQEQQTLLAEIDTLKADARRIAKEAGVNRPRLNQPLRDIVQKATTTADVRQGLTALRALLEKLIPKAQEAARLQSGYTSPLVKWDQIPFPALLDQAARLRQQGAEFDVEFIPELGHTEFYYEDKYYEDMHYQQQSSSSFVVDNPQSVRLGVQQPPAAPPVVEPPKPPVLDHQFLKESGVLDALQNEWSHLSQPFLSDQNRLAVHARIGQHKLKEVAIGFDASRTGLLPGYVALSALGQEVIIRVFRPEDRRLLTPIQTALVRGEITPELHYEVFPHSEFDTMVGPDGFIDWKMAVPTAILASHVEETDAPQPFPQVSKATEGAVAQLAEEFSLEQLIETSRIIQLAEKETEEVIYWEEKVDDFTEALNEAGLPATQEQFLKAIESLRGQTHLLAGEGEGTRTLWAVHRIAAEFLGSDDPSKRIRLFEKAANRTFESTKVKPLPWIRRLARTERLIRAQKVRERAIAVGVPIEELYPALRRAIGLAKILSQVSSEAPIEQQLSWRNWLWRTSKAEERSSVLPRIRAVQERLPAILERLSQAGEAAPISVYAMGGGIWSDQPNDLDLFVIVPGGRLYEIHTLPSPPGELPLHVRSVGLDTFSKAVAGQPVENRTNIRLEATNLYGSGVLIAGTDLFAQTRPPEENLAPVAQHYREAIQWLQTTSDVPEEQKLSKVDRWIRELQAIEQELAEHRKKVQETFVRQKVDELAQSITRLDEGLQRYLAPPVQVVDERPAALIIPREALVDGVGVVSLRRLHETHQATVIAVTGNFTEEEKALLRRLDSRLRFIEGVTVADPVSAAQALEAARSAAWWTPDVPARVLVPTLDLNARPMELPGGRLLYYLAPDKDHLISLDILLQATHQDLFQSTFPVVQVILARIPIESAGLKDQVSDFRERWALAAGA